MVKLSESGALTCPCGKEATYICECGCPCCGEDPCAFGCGGSVVLLSDARDKWPDLEIRMP